MPSFDIVIPHRGGEMGLWMTLTSCEQELKRLRSENPSLYNTFDYKYYISHNGDLASDSATELMLDHFKSTGKLGEISFSQGALAPPTARNLGAALGTGEFIFFFDNHCMVDQGYFDRALECFDLCEADAVHSVTKFWPGDVARFHYRFTLETNFWAYQVDRPKKDGPYLIAGAAHGGFAVRRSVWAELGGYWDGFRGYGGEEMYWELLMGLTDKKNFMHTGVSHWHHPGNRSYVREKSLDFVKNMMMCAHIIGGDAWLGRVCSGLKIKESQKKPEERMNLNWQLIAQDAYNQSLSQRKYVESISKRSLNEQLVRYPRIGAAM